MTRTNTSGTSPPQPRQEHISTHIHLYMAFTRRISPFVSVHLYAATATCLALPDIERVNRVTHYWHTDPDPLSIHFTFCISPDLRLSEPLALPSISRR